MKSLKNVMRVFMAVAAVACLGSVAAPARAEIKQGGIVRADNSLANVYAANGLVSVLGNRERFYYFCKPAEVKDGDKVVAIEYKGKGFFTNRLTGLTTFDCTITLTEYPSDKSVSWRVVSPSGEVLQDQERIALVKQ